VSVEELTLKSAAELIRRTLPQIIYLFASFFRRRARRFHAISEHGTLLDRVALTASLALICALTSYLVTSIDPFDGMEGVMGGRQRAIWAALIPLIAMPPICWLLQRHSDRPIIATFLNLGLVTSATLIFLPSVLLLAGVTSSALSGDIAKLRAGHAAGTPVHDIYCGSIERRAEIGATMRDLNNGNSDLVRLAHALQANMRDLAKNREEMNAAGNRMLAARRAGQPEDLYAAQLFAAMERGTRIMEQGLSINEKDEAVLRRNLDLEIRSIDLENEQTLAPLHLISAYPVAAIFLGISAFVGLLIWLFAAVIAWALVVTPQPTRRRKLVVGTLLVLIFAGLWIGFGLLRSGVLEEMIQESPSREMLVAQTRAQFEASTPMCGPLNNYGLW
jgi:hypothetical protein